jgi:hypothetical protein
MVVNGAADSFVVSGEESASDSRAVWSDSGSVLPRRFARRRMPSAAFALKENLSGAVGFKTCDNEDSTAALGDSKESSIQSSPRYAIPEFVHLTEKPGKVSSVIGCEKPRYVLQHEPPRSSLLHKVKEGEGKAGSFA